MHKDILKSLSVITPEEQRILEGQKNIDTHIYTENKELIIDCEKLLQKGKLIQVRTHTRFIHFPKHRHNYIEVIYMCQGNTTHFINGSKVVLEQGDVLFLNQNAVQEILPAGEHDIAINFIILPEFFDTAFSMIGQEENLLRTFLVDILSPGKLASSYLYFHVADVLPVQNLIENMVWTIQNDQPGKRSINQTTMGLLILQLSNYLDKAESDSRKFEQEFVIAVLSYIEEHYKDGSLTELSEVMGYDVFWLSREIKKQLGKTYKELLMEKRMSQACYLLQNSSISITSIIDKIGYENSSYFYRKFKEHYGISPKEYRVKNCK